jgi:hypothetical protein
MGHRAFASGLVALSTLPLACASHSGQQGLGNVLSTKIPKEQIPFKGRVGQVVDFELPTPVPVHIPVTLTAVTFTSIPAGARVDSIHAYRYDATGGGDLLDTGDVPTKYPNKFVPSPVSDVTMSPGKISAWYLVGSLTWSTPTAHVQIPAIRLSYVDGNGNHGSQVIAVPISGVVT